MNNCSNLKPIEWSESFHKSALSRKDDNDYDRVDAATVRIWVENAPSASKLVGNLYKSALMIEKRR
jgi:hypothetical protein